VSTSLPLSSSSRGNPYTYIRGRGSRDKVSGGKEVKVRGVKGKGVRGV
jgi:hypothetical protein